MTLLVVDRLRGSSDHQPISFELAAGERLALIGPDGGAILDLIGGQRRPRSGRIRLGDDDVTSLGPRALCRLGVGRTLRSPAVFDSMTSRENLQIALLAARDACTGWWRPIRGLRRSHADSVLDRVGLLAHADRSAASLSHTERARLDLALALAPRPRLLLLDEPTRDLATLAQRWAAADETGVLLTGPDMPAVTGLADRVLLLDGRCVASAATLQTGT